MTHSIWIKRSKTPNIKTYVAVNYQQHEELLKDYLKNDYLINIGTDKIGVCYPSYRLSSSLGDGMGICENNDIVIFASDDFIPPENWDEYLIQKLTNKSGALLVNDGYQALDFSNMAEPVFSIPVMTFDCLLKLNKIIYNPAYTHLCSDAELFLNLKEMNLIIDDRVVDFGFVFEHHHWSSGKRKSDQNDQSYYSNFEKDKNTWEMRKRMTLQERLKVEIRT
jgi:hypothetical protein